MLGEYVGGPISAATYANPGLFELLLRCFWCQQGSADFEVSSIQVYLNMTARPHRDSSDSGPSARVDMGAFSGGNLLVWDDDDDVAYPEVIDAKSEPTSLDARVLVFFDGNKVHATAPFIGL